VKTVQLLLINITLGDILFFAVECISSATVTKANLCNLFCPCPFSCRSGISIHIVRHCWNQAHDRGQAAAAACVRLVLHLLVWADELLITSYNYFLLAFFLLW